MKQLVTIVENINNFCQVLQRNQSFRVLSIITSAKKNYKLQEKIFLYELGAYDANKKDIWYNGKKTTLFEQGSLCLWAVQHKHFQIFFDEDSPVQLYWIV